MYKIRIWTLESDYDADAVSNLAHKLVKHLNLDDVVVNVVGRSAIPRRVENGLIKAVKDYLKDDDRLIFVIDSDGPMASFERQQQPRSLANQIKNVLADKEIAHKVFRADAVCELEAWLLIDCIGIMCYYLSNRYKTDCRDRIKQNKQFMKVVAKNQKGKTDLIVEAEMGGKGVKEYLEKYTEQILQTINPDMPSKNIDQEKYREALSPVFAQFIEIDSQTIKKATLFFTWANCLR